MTRGRLAQLGEHRVRNAGVGGSNPLPSTNIHLDLEPTTLDCSGADRSSTVEGNSTRKVAPPSGRFQQEMRPPCSCTIP